MTGTRQRMSLPLLASLTGGIPPAEFSWVRAAAPRAKTKQQIQSFKESADSEIKNRAIPSEAILPRPKYHCEQQKFTAKGGKPLPFKGEGEFSRLMAHVAKTRQVFLYKNNLRTLPEPARIEELDGELGMSKSARLLLVG